MHAQMRQVDAFRIECKPLLYALADAVVLVGWTRSPIRGIHDEIINAADTLFGVIR